MLTQHMIATKVMISQPLNIAMSVLETVKVLTEGHFGIRSPKESREIAPEERSKLNSIFYVAPPPHTG